MKLDEKCSKSSKMDKTRPMKPCRQVPYSNRMPPLNAPKWALSKKPEEVGSLKLMNLVWQIAAMMMALIIPAFLMISTIIITVTMMMVFNAVGIERN